MSRHDMCFNSLQTGKWIQTELGFDDFFFDDFVSIPFKRESGFKHVKALRKEVRKEFQFPSNGKVDSNQLTN